MLSMGWVLKILIEIKMIEGKFFLMCWVWGIKIVLKLFGKELER